MNYKDINLKKHILQIIDKINENNYWDVNINKNALYKNFNYLCIFYVIILYEIFTYNICKNSEYSLLYIFFIIL